MFADRARIYVRSCNMSLVDVKNMFPMADLMAAMADTVVMSYLKLMKA